MRTSVAELQKNSPDMLSIVMPVYNERANLQLLYDELVQVMDSRPDIEWEAILVDDHSTDGSEKILRKFSQMDERIQYVRLARNEGSHSAIIAGLKYARGGCAAIMASDLQDPPESLLRMYDHWKQGFQCIWMVRCHNQSDAYKVSLFGKIYYSMVKRLNICGNMPSEGADALLMDNAVKKALLSHNLRNIPLFLFVRTLGFRSINLSYAKRERKHGTSNWSTYKKARHFLNTIFMFSNLPLKLLLGCSFSLSVLFLLFSVYIVLHRLLLGHSIDGWHSIAFMISMSFSLLFSLLGILSGYMWRIFIDTQNAPLFFIEEDSFSKPKHEQQQHEQNENTCTCHQETRNDDRAK